MADRYQNRPQFPDKIDRGPSHQPAHQPVERHESDPLAELARLIGQTDPESPFARGRQGPGPQSQQLGRATDFGTGQPSWLQAAQSHREPGPGAAFEPDPADGDGDSELTPLPAFLHNAQPPEADAHYAGSTQHDYDSADYEPSQHHESSRYDQVLYGQEQGYQQYDERQGYEDDYPAEEQYEAAGALDDRSRPRRGGMLTVAVVLGLGVLGTAGAYAYRSYSGSPRSGTPPIIKADATPTKVVPPTQSSDGSGKLIYDRIGTGGPERVVSREEQPVDVTANAPRPAFPAVNPTAQGVAIGQQASAGGDAASDEPRKIRTVPIRADQAGAAQATPRQAPSPMPVRTVPVQTAAAPGANGPLALAPSNGGELRSASAAVPPANVVRTGGYFVQISSQKSEADAQASFRAAQAKYASLLGTSSPVIKRADLGEKGVYYRAMVGPFGTSEEAGKLCSNLKIAGGACVVQRN